MNDNKSGQESFYIGPGTDLVFQSFGVVAAFLAGIFAVIGLFFGMVYSVFKKNKKQIIVFILIVILAATAFLFYNSRKDGKMKVIILGIDGMDPVVTEKMMKDGKLPNFTKMAENGFYGRLSTTNPPQSPVAWASFITGCNPGRHGIFDFLKRNPDNYMPDLSLTDVKEPKYLKIGGKKIPLGRSEIVSTVKGLAFWKILLNDSIECQVLRCPMTFPPEKLNGHMLSGLGTPDLNGTQGTFSFYTTKEADAKLTGGRVILVKGQGGEFNSNIFGPRNTSDANRAETTIQIRMQKNPAGDKLSIAFQNNNFELEPGGWSGWKKLEFDMGGLTKANGICRFYLKAISPDLELYMSPINFDPERPVFPVTYPSSYSKVLANELGLFHTLGQAGDTWALNEGLISERTALEQYYQVLGEDEKLLFNELEKYRSGVFFFYFGITDTISHMFWNSKNREVEDIYCQMDRILGKVNKYCDENTVLIILSDHGFGEYKRAVHLNTWLKENRYLTLKDGESDSSELFENVDWSKTRAYAVGLSGIYLNIQGRESEGIVQKKDANGLANEIAAKLSVIKDTETGRRAVKNVYLKSDIYSGPSAQAAPDLVVGFNRGWRASWQTALGGVPSVVFEDNEKKWRGDHIFDHTEVPGVLFVNRKVKKKDNSIMDVVPTVLEIMKIKKKSQFDGREFL